MKKILIFAGTTEGRKLAEFLRGKRVKVYVSTATEYGRECIETAENEIVIAGRMDEAAMASFMELKTIDIVIDATHPFAVDVSRNIKAACKHTNTEYIRCLRDANDKCDTTNASNKGGHASESTVNQGDIIIVESLEEAVIYCKEHSGNIFITTGSKELAKYTEIEDYKERCYARVLSTETAVVESIQLGFVGKHLIAMQGPFSKEMNVAMMQAVQAEIMVTKESGSFGGFTEKVEAAKEVGALLVVVARPQEEGTTLEGVMEKLERI